MSFNCNNQSYEICGPYLYNKSCTATPIPSDSIVYNGPNLPGSGINTYNNLTTALQKLDNEIKLIKEQLTTTTTTTTVAPTTTTTTTTVAPTTTTTTTI